MSTPHSPDGEHPSVQTHEPKPLSPLNTDTVLRELFDLLEDYSPVWYTEENHHRAVAALKLAVR
jgi:hypothetical protein